MDYLKNNLELIKQNSISLYNIINEAPDEDFELEVEVSKKGPLTMKTKGEKNIYLHSRYNPENEARKIIEKGIENDTDVVVIGGFALGYLPEAVLKLDKIPDIIVIEKSAKIIKEAFSARDFRPLLTSGKFDFLITGRIEDATTLLDNKATRKISMIIHRPSYDLFPDFYQNLRNVIYSFINSKEVNIATLARFEKLWTRNLLRNLQYFITQPGINTLYNKFNDVPAFIIGAGPSLSKNIDLLKTASSKGIIIAVDTVYKVLLAHGIVPHFVIAVDPQIINFQYFRGIKDTDTCLVADSAVSPTLLRNFRGKIYISSVPFPFATWFEKFFGEKKGMSSGGSVSTSAFDLTINMGCNPVVFLGQDLAYSDDRIHIKGSPGEEIWENSSDRLTPASRNLAGFLKKNKTIKAESYDGNSEVWTDRKFMTFLWWFENKIASLPGIKIINSTEGGAKIKGAINEKFSTLLNKLPDLDISKSHDPTIINEKEFKITYDFIDEFKRFMTFLNKTIKVTDDGKQICKKLLISEDHGLYKKLNKIDAEINSDKNFSWLISSTLQRIIHSVREGFSISDKEGKTESEKVLNESRQLYTDINKACLEIKKFMGKYIDERYFE